MNSNLHITRRGALLGGAALVGAAAAGVRPSFADGDITFDRVKLGGGGYCVDIDISPDGLTRLVRTDVHDCYIWSDADDEWKSLCNATTMPADERVMGNNGAAYACYALRVAPSNSSILYAVYPARSGLGDRTTVYKSTDRGASWAKTGLTPSNMTIEDNGRYYGQKMAVDPINPDHVIIGNTAGEIWRTINGGTSWSLLSTPVGAWPVVQFDLNNSNNVYIGWFAGNNGIYRSTDNGATFSQMAGSPANVKRMASATDGTIWMTVPGIGGQNAYNLRGTTFTLMSPTHGGGWHSISPDPFDPDHVTLGYSAGNIVTTINGGTTWGTFYRNAAIRDATGDVTWLSWTLEDSMSNGNMVYDPIVEGKLWFAEGIGIWYTQDPPLDSTRPTWHSVTRGTDQLIVDDVIWPPGGRPILTVQDRGVFRIADPNVYPATHGPGRTVALQHGVGADWASSDPNFICVAGNKGPQSYYSTDGGLTWAAFASQAPWDLGSAVGGGIAALTPLNIMCTPSNNGFAQYTLDGGVTWTLCNFPPGVPVYGVNKGSGWGFLWTTVTHYCAADRVTSTFWAWNYSTSSVYKSVDGGANFTQVNAAPVQLGAVTVGGNQSLQAVPGHAGHLFLTSGPREANISHPRQYGFKRSVDGGGVTWTDVPNVQESWAFGFGKEAPGQSYPALYLAGYVNGDPFPGIYRSIDNCVTWTLLTNAPANSLDVPRAIAGDMNEYGSFYIGLGGSGAVHAYHNK